MKFLTQAIVVMLITFGASVIGALLQSVVPVQTLSESKATIGAMIGLITLLLALVLGFLVFTAFSVFSIQQSEAQSLGPLAIEIDVALELYGVDAARGRAVFRAGLERARTRFFGDAQRGPQPWTLAQTRATLRGFDLYFDSLNPETEKQRQLLASAKDLVRKFNDTQMLMARQIATPFPPYVLPVVICWASVLFFGNGLVSTPNVMTETAILVGAAAVGSAMFLILELSNPYMGVIRFSPDGIDRLLQSLAEADSAVTAGAVVPAQKAG